MLFGIPGKPPPKKCFCGARLPQPKYDASVFGTYCKVLNIYVGEKLWNIKCNKCKTNYVWSYPQQWEERNKLPLFDTRKII